MPRTPWRNIARGLGTIKKQSVPNDRGGAGEMVQEQAELIIYRRQNEDGHSVDSVKEHFLAVAGVHDQSERAAIADRIHVIIYDDSTPRVFLNSRFMDEAATD